MTTGGPDAGAFCVFPFIWKSKVHRSCAEVRKVFSCATIASRDHRHCTDLLNDPFEIRSDIRPDI